MKLVVDGNPQDVIEVKEDRGAWAYFAVLAGLGAAGLVGLGFLFF